MITPEKRCKNCTHHLIMNQKFCHQCGQKTDTERINFHFLIHEIQHSIFHVDGGILFTLKEIFTRPGHTLREYLDGKRKNHFKPVLFVMILGAIYSFLNHYLINEEERVNNIKFGSGKVRKSENFDFNKLFHFLDYSNDWLNNHYALALLMLVPVFAFGFYLAFKKYKINYAEWLVISTFITGQSLAIGIVFLFLQKIFPGSYIISKIIAFGFTIWTIIQFFNNRPKGRIFLRSLWGYFLYWFSAFLLILIGTGIILLIIKK